MSEWIKISQGELVAYITGKADAELRSRVQKIMDTAPEYKVVLDLLTNIRQRGTVDLEHPAKPSGRVDAIRLEATLERLLSGSATAEDDRVFVHAMLTSPHLYELVMLKLSRVAALETETIPEMEMVTIPSREEFLQIVFRETPPQPALAGVGQKLRGIWDWLKQRKGYVIPIPAALAAVLALFLIIGGSGPLAQYEERWNSEVPAPLVALAEVAPAESQLRGAGAEVRSDWIAFSKLFRQSLATYQKRDYRAALGQLSRLQAQAEALEQSLGDEQLVQELGPQEATKARELLRNYYFYLGVSQLAYSRVNGDRLEDAEKDRYAHQAIRFISRALTLAETHRLGQSDRERFFLGLALAFAGNTPKALEHWRQIGSNSPYFQEADRLINALGK